MDVTLIIAIIDLISALSYGEPKKDCRPVDPVTYEILSQTCPAPAPTK